MDTFGLWYDMARPTSKHWRSMFWADGWLFKIFSIQTVVQFRCKARPLRLTTWWRDPRPTLLGLHMFSCSRLGGEDLTTLWSSPVAAIWFNYLGLILESLGMSWSFLAKVWNAFWFCLFDCQYGVVLHFCRDLRGPNRTSLYWQA